MYGIEIYANTYIITYLDKLVKINNKLLCERTIDVTRAATENNSGNAVENAWSKLKDPLLCAATVVCGLSKNHQWRPETWWWNDTVEDAVKEKRIRYKAYNALKKAGKVVEAKEAKTANNEAKRVAKRVSG